MKREIKNRKRGNRRGANAREAKKAAAIAAKQQGLSHKEIEQQIGVSHATLWRYFNEMDIDWAALNAAALGPLKQKVVEQLAQRADDVLAGRLPPKVADAWRGLMAELSKVVGLHAPIRTQSTNTNLEVTVEPNFYRWAWRLFENVPDENTVALKAECEAIAAKYRIAPTPFTIQVPANILSDGKDCVDESDPTTEDRR
jgi:transcriptional regulator with XRE-family HTH domain